MLSEYYWVDLEGAAAVVGESTWNHLLKKPWLLNRENPERNLRPRYLATIVALAQFFPASPALTESDTRERKEGLHHSGLSCFHHCTCCKNNPFLV